MEDEDRRLTQKLEGYLAWSAGYLRDRKTVLPH